jgi:hypothetical protein
MEALLRQSWSDIKGSGIESAMYFGSGSVVAAADVLLVVALVVVALLVMPLIHDRAARLIISGSEARLGGLLGKLTSSRPRLRIRRLKHDGAGRPTKRAPVGRS